MPDGQFQYFSRLLLETAIAAKVPRQQMAGRMLNQFRHLVRRVDPTLTLEIGAFEGDFSRWIVRNIPDARAIAFEANPHVYPLFQPDLAAAGVDYRNACVGNTNGTARLNIPLDRRGAPRDHVNRIASLNRHLWTDDFEVVEIDSVRLDDAVDAGPDDRIVAWIDVEGAQEVVLSGAEKTLGQAALIYIEVENTTVAEHQWLDLDVARWFEGINKVPIMRDWQRPHQYNLLFASEALAAEAATVRSMARVLRPPEGREASQSG